LLSIFNLLTTKLVNEMPKVSVIVPCFNEEAVLPKLFERLDKAAMTWGLDYEVLCVDDGSRDGTWELLKAQHQRNPRWHCLCFARNFGHQVAVSAGLCYASGDAVVVLDADLQDPPEELARFFEKWREGFQVVYAVRQKRKETFFKRFCYWAFYRLMARMTRFHVPLDAGDFCLMDRRVVDILNQMPERNRFVRGMRAWAGFKQIGIPYERQARAAGEPKYSFSRLVGLAWDGVSSFSSAPLHVATYLGFWVSTFAFMGAVFTFFQKIFAAQFTRIGLAPNPRGFPTVVISVLFLGGVQLICLGILGEYVGRIYDEVKHRPLWIVRESAGVTIEAPPQPPAAK
jgi:polyisoprenyl-phosphate glycosyltransferase